jgi:hypothetical protein
MGDLQERFTKYFLFHDKFAFVIVRHKFFLSSAFVVRLIYWPTVIRRHNVISSVSPDLLYPNHCHISIVHMLSVVFFLHVTAVCASGGPCCLKLPALFDILYLYLDYRWAPSLGRSCTARVGLTSARVASSSHPVHLSTFIHILI